MENALLLTSLFFLFFSEVTFVQIALVWLAFLLWPQPSPVSRAEDCLLPQILCSAEPFAELQLGSQGTFQPYHQNIFRRNDFEIEIRESPFCGGYRPGHEAQRGKADAECPGLCCVSIFLSFRGQLWRLRLWAVSWVKFLQPTQSPGCAGQFDKVPNRACLFDSPCHKHTRCWCVRKRAGLDTSPAVGSGCTSRICVIWDRTTSIYRSPFSPLWRTPTFFKGMFWG